MLLLAKRCLSGNAVRLELLDRACATHATHERCRATGVGTRDDQCATTAPSCGTTRAACRCQRSLKLFVQALRLALKILALLAERRELTLELRLGASFGLGGEQP